MASFCKVIMVGNLTAQPELRQTTTGLSVCKFRIAVNRKYGSETDFFTIVTFRQTAEFVCRHFKKGNPILVCGSLQTNSWKDKQGATHTDTEVFADEVSFVGTKEIPTEQTLNQYEIHTNKFEEVHGDEALPF